MEHQSFPCASVEIPATTSPPVLPWPPSSTLYNPEFILSLPTTWYYVGTLNGNEDERWDSVQKHDNQLTHPKSIHATVASLNRGRKGSPISRVLSQRVRGAMVSMSSGINYHIKWHKTNSSYLFCHCHRKQWRRCCPMAAVTCCHGNGGKIRASTHNPDRIGNK